MFVAIPLVVAALLSVTALLFYRAATTNVSNSDVAREQHAAPVLPSGEQCAQRVPRTGWEPRPSNTVANRTVPELRPLPNWPDYWDPAVNSQIVPRIDGRFTGTTDEILAWGACKWGFEADLVRAIAVSESSWYQSKLGDLTDDPGQCVGGYRVPCPTSFGILQIKHVFRPGSYPYSQQSTAFNVDYALAVIRGCFEGRLTYLENGYRAGDLWGCIGWHYSGEWNDPTALDYIASVKDHLKEKPWKEWPGG